MASSALPRPAAADIKQHLLTAFHQYWERAPQQIASLPIATLEFPTIEPTLRLESIALPDWATHCGVAGALLVPAEACPHGDDWRRVDWWLAGFLLLEGWHERVYEERHGPIHSYSFRLRDWDSRVWRHAWVNRIAIFLRLWAAELQRVDDDSLFGPLPAPEIMMTHDVDAVSKTLPIRFKQGSFNLLKAALQFGKGQWTNAGLCLRQAMRFFLGQENWWTFDKLLAMEEAAGIRSRFHFYADGRRKTPLRWLFDPGYDVMSERMRKLFDRLDAGGWRTGLHQSFDAWKSDALIAAQRQRLIEACSADVNTCRQHWLRFSWGETWAAQEAAGLEEDTTLMFNDRMGFRSAAAIAWNPWRPRTARAHGIRAVPTVLMDSHAYDYQPMTCDERRSEIRHWLEELKTVGGRCALLWHPHTLGSDYAWADGFQDCINLSAELKICVNH